MPLFKLPLHFVLVLLIITLQAGVQAELTISITTFGPRVQGKANSVMGTGNQIASSLLGSSTPAVLWGVLSSTDVNAVCTQLVNTGSASFDATFKVNSGGSSLKSMQVTNIGGCLAAADASGTEAVLYEPKTDRKSAVVCPSDAGSKGCGVYLMGNDVNKLWNSGANQRLLSARNVSKESCTAGLLIGIPLGIALSLTHCLELGPILGAFCFIGEMFIDVGIDISLHCPDADNCFPGDAIVTLESGKIKRMTDLVLGDKVAVRLNNGGQVSFQDVYAFGHKDAMAVAEFVQLTMKPVETDASDFSVKDKVLELSALHFAPIVQAADSTKMLYKRGKDITVGDHMLAEGAPMYVVTSISRVRKAGLYNPFTLGGTIIVNGVMASTHSNWFLDAAFDFLGLTHLLPASYQVVLLPARVLYHILGKELYISIYHQLDALVNIAALGTSHGASIFAGMSTSFVVISALLLSRGIKLVR